jgi:hypothetical protein
MTGQFYFQFRSTRRENPMSRNSRLNARCTAAEKDLLVQVAQAMQRTPSDALRFLVYEKAQALEIPHMGTMPYFPLGIQGLGID